MCAAGGRREPILFGQYSATGAVAVFPIAVPRLPSYPLNGCMPPLSPLHRRILLWELEVCQYKDEWNTLDTIACSPRTSSSIDPLPRFHVLPHNSSDAGIFRDKCMTVFVSSAVNQIQLQQHVSLPFTSTAPPSLPSWTRRLSS